MKNYVVGIDLGGTSIKFGVFTIDGELIFDWKIPTNRDADGERILHEIASSLQEKFSYLNIHESTVQGVGVGIPGIVMESGSRCTCVNLGWKEKNVKKELEELLLQKVVIINDANAAALGEMWKGSAIGSSNLVFITIGTGIGGGVIVSDKIVPGTFGAGGEIGHMSMGVHTENPCGCGRFGCLEQIASATGIQNEFRRRILTGSAHTLCQENFSVKEIFEAAETGDTLALEVVDGATYWLGKAMANISSIIDPEIFILGGGVSEAGEVLLNLVTRHFRKHVLENSSEAKIALAIMGNQAGIYGAAKSVLG